MGRPLVQNPISPKVIDPTQPLPNEQHEKYCIGYLEKGTKIKAYYYAGYAKCNGDRQQACQIHDLPDIQARLKYLRTKRLSILDLDDEFLIIEQARLAKFDMRKMFDENGLSIPIQDLPEDITRCIKSIKIVNKGQGKKKEEVTEVTFHAKSNALDALMKNRGLFGKNNEQLKPALYLEVGRSEE